MEKILSRLQDKMTRLGSAYADLRYVETRRLKIRTKDAGIEEIKETQSRGVGFRVLDSGSVGFASTPDLTEKNLLVHLERAHHMARQFSKIRHADVEMKPRPAVKAKWSLAVKMNPWKMKHSHLAAPLTRAENKLGKYSCIDSTNGTLDFTLKNIIFVSSEGSWIDQTLYRTGGWLAAESWMASKGSPHLRREKIRRTWPGPSGVYRAQGYEAICDFDFPAQTGRIAEELKELRSSPETPFGTFDLILKGSILALQIHETFGHAAEADRVYGYEDNFGGRTFLVPGLIDGFQAASPAVSLTSDASLRLGPGAGCFGYDDEGIKAGESEIIKKGLFTGYMTSRETAFFLNQAGSSANMVAQDWSHLPLIRMTNLNLLAGKGTLAEMIRDTEEGFMLDNELSWSVDEMRLDFHIGGEAGYRIKNGKIHGMVRFPFYHGNTLDFWRSCDRVAGQGEWGFYGFSDCGKGGPYQEAFTGHGLSPARFRRVHFGRE